MALLAGPLAKLLTGLLAGSLTELLTGLLMGSLAELLMESFVAFTRHHLRHRL
ncbi:hypothetical protein [Streptomyces rimosus]|uniref:hypothetical protein n=1 Tax=Streptomyces rimosus TaxID=1927 RepID=UPI00131E3762|nr:hypothetical protein [Streptomyces rimosus]